LHKEVWTLTTVPCRMWVCLFFPVCRGCCPKRHLFQCSSDFSFLLYQGGGLAAR
jgi:hypothetical protein